MRTLTSIFKWSLFAIALAALLLLGVYGALQTQWGKERMITLLESQLNAEIERVSGTLPFAPRMESLTLKDAQGAWLIVNNIALDWRITLSPLTWHIQSLKAESIHWLRLPKSEKETASSDFSMPNLPRLEIKRLALPRIQIEEAVARQRQLLMAEGDLRTYASEGDAESHFRLSTLEGPKTALTIITRGLKEMTVEAALTEEANGVIGTMAGLPDRPLRVETRFMLNGDESVTIEHAQIAANGMKAALTGTVSTLFSEPEFKLKGELIGLETSSDLLAKLVPGGVVVDVEGKRSGDGLHISTFQARVEHAALEGKNLSLNGESIAGDVHITVPDARHLHADLQGALTAEAKIGGIISRPEAQLSVALQDERRTLNLAVFIKMDDTLLRFSEIKGGAKGLDVSGALAYDTQTALADGKLRVEASDLSGLNAFLAADVKGSGSVDVTLAGANGKQRMEAQGNLAGIRYGDTGISSAMFQFRASDVITLEGIDAEVKANALRMGETVIDTLILSAQGSGQNTQLTLNAESKAAPAFSLHSAGTLKAKLPDWALALNALSGEWEGTAFALAVPAAMTRKEERLTLTPLRINVAGGNIEAKGLYSLPRVDLRITASSLPLGRLTDNAAEGTLNGAVRVTGTAARPSAALEARVTGLADRLKEKGGFTLGITGTLASENLNLRAQVENIEGQLRAKAKLPARFALSPFEFALPPDGRLSGNLNANAQLGPLLAPLLPEGQTLSGYAKGDLALRGTLGAPWVEGALTLNNGRYVNQAVGTMLENIDVRLEAQRDRLAIARGSARAGGGRVTLAGDIGLKNPYPFSLQAKLDNAEIIDRSEASGVVNGDIQLSGDITAPLVTGDLVLGPMEIRLPEGSDVDVPVLKIRNPEVLPVQVWQTKEEPGKIVLGPDKVKLEVKVSTPSRVFVRGRGLETEMRGDVAIGGTLGAPAIEGQLRSVRGAFTLLDRRLDITEGTLMFRGAMPPSPYVRMVAETDTGELTAGIRLEGPVRAPELTLTSTPARPEDEIMAHLLFGRELRSITPFQGIQLAQAVQTLRGKGGGVDLLGKARNLLGVDRLDVSETDSGDLGVGAGKYISDKIYIGVEGGADPEEGKVKAEIEASPRFSVETETGGRSSGVRFNWKRDY